MSYYALDRDPRLAAQALSDRYVPWTTMSAVRVLRGALAGVWGQWPGPRVWTEDYARALVAEYELRFRRRHAAAEFLDTVSSQPLSPGSIFTPFPVKHLPVRFRHFGCVIAHRLAYLDRGLLTYDRGRPAPAWVEERRPWITT